jgi:sugar lactone lactonase YvrE
VTLYTRFFLALLAIPLAAQNISTIAGGGPRNLTATALGIANPAGVAVDSSGNVYVAVPTTHQVFKITPGGVVNLFAGNGSAGPYDGESSSAAAVTLGAPSGMAFDTAGNLYVADTAQNRVRKITPAGAISTFAGNGTPGFSGDTGLAANASLNAPTGLAVDASNNVFIADTGNQRIRMVLGATSVISTVAGNGTAGYTTDFPTPIPAATAALNNPVGLAVDSGGSVYVADSLNLRIRKITSPTSSPLIVTIAGNGTNSFTPNPTPATGSGLNDLVNVAVDRNNNVFVVESFDVREVASGSANLTLFAGTGTFGFSGDGTFSPTTATFRNIAGIGIDSTAANVYIADSANARIRRIVTASGAVSTFAGNGSLDFSGDGGAAVNANLFAPSTPAIDTGGNLLFADIGAFSVRKVTLSSNVLSTVAGNGQAGTTADGQPAAGNPLNGAFAVVVDNNGNFYFTETGHVRKVSAGILGTLAPGTAFSNPAGLAVAPNGNVYIADASANKVLLYNAQTAAVTTIAGTGASGFSGDGGAAVNATLSGPSPLALDPVSNKLYIGDIRNNRVRVVDLVANTIDTFAGNGTTAFSDGVAPTATGLNSPTDLHLDAAGNLYIADEQHFRVRKISGGLITTVAGNGTQDYTGDGGAALSAAVQPHGITFDGSGTLYIADASGRIRTVAGIGPSAPTAVSETSNASSGSSQTFTGVYSDPSGSGRLNRRQFLINSSLNFVNACFVQIDSSGIYLANDANTAFTGPLSGSGALSNSQCTLNGPGTGVSSSGNNSTVTLSISFTPAFAGAKNIYLFADDGLGNSSGYQLRGTFTVGGFTGTGTALYFVPITPCRVLDTRHAAGPFGGPSIAGQTSRSFVIPDSACGIPSNAQAYSMNVAVVPQGPLGFLTVWPTGQSQPNVATLNSTDGRIKSNAAIFPAGTGGSVSIFATNTADVVLDINGYFLPAGGTGLQFYPVTPCRLVDTRHPNGPLAGPFIGGQSTRTFPLVSGTCGIPGGVQSYSLNFAAVPHGPLGFITAWPTGQSQPATATLNASTGTVTANASLVPAGTGGSINVFATNDTDLVIDVNGYFAAPGSPGALSLFTATPCRVLDTRRPAGSLPFSGAIDVNVATSGCGAPVTGQAWVFNATVVPSAALGFLTLWPQGTTQPNVATLNALDAAITGNMAIVPDTSGSISAFATNPTHLVLDLFGYFAP